MVFGPAKPPKPVLLGQLRAKFKVTEEKVKKRGGAFDTEPGCYLPDSYVNFFREWKKCPKPVHWIKEKGKWKRDEETGLVYRVRHLPVRPMVSREMHSQMWGGAGFVKGFKYIEKIDRIIPFIWPIHFKQSVIHTEILNVYIRMIMTERLISQIHQNQGFDHYLLKTPACDVASLCALHLKRKILQELEKGCPSHANDPKRQQELLDEYGPYLKRYTSEDIEWYGYSFSQALIKLQNENMEKTGVPLKAQYRAELIRQLKEETSAEVDFQEHEDTKPWLRRTIDAISRKHTKFLDDTDK